MHPLSIDVIMAAARAPAQSRAARYMARVEDHLPTVEDRAAFLRRELDKWQERYTSWALRVDLGTATDDDLAVSAYDFLETITALDRRLHAATNTPDGLPANFGEGEC